MINKNIAKNSISAVILSAGSSTRMQGANKQLLEIKNIPVVIRSIQIFEKSDYINEIILVAKKEDINVINSIAFKYNLKKLKPIIEGGETRFDSSKIGVQNTSKNAKYVLIHDGARPFASVKLVNKICEKLYKNKAVAPGIKITDTIKNVDDNNKVIDTLNRESLRSIQTPQGFLKSLYLEALEEIVNSDFLTDDCSIIENYGKKVLIIEGETNNIKITTQEDVKLAEYINL